MFVIGSGMFWYAMILRHSDPAQADFGQTLESFGILIVALSLALGVYARHKPR